MKRPVPAESASAYIDAKINELADWRGKTLAKVRAIIHKADPDIVEEWKWMGTPVWSHDGIVCTGETYKNVVKMTFSKGASLKDASGLFSSLAMIRNSPDVRSAAVGAVGVRPLQGRPFPWGPVPWALPTATLCIRFADGVFGRAERGCNNEYASVPADAGNSHP